VQNMDALLLTAASADVFVPASCGIGKTEPVPQEIIACGAVECEPNAAAGASTRAAVDSSPQLAREMPCTKCNLDYSKAGCHDRFLPVGGWW